MSFYRMLRTQQYPLPILTAVRILVTDILEQVATGMAWETIVDDWRGDLSKEAIAEAVRLQVAQMLAALGNNG